MPSMSRDGSAIAFQCYTSETNPTNIWLYKTETTSMTLVTEGFHDDSTSLNPRLNGDGTMLVFQSEVVHWNEEIWVYWAETGEFKKITDATKGVGTNADISADGTLVVFQSDADFTGPGMPPAPHEIWLYEIATETYTRITTASDNERAVNDN
jgi:Tol biopolymer transport system component